MIRLTKPKLFSGVQNIIADRFVSIVFHPAVLVVLCLLFLPILVPLFAYSYGREKWKNWEYDRFINILKINKKYSPNYIKEQPICINDTENVEKAKKYLSRLSPEKLTKLWNYFYRDHKVFLIFIQSREMIDVMTQYGFDINHTKKSKTSNYFIHPLTTEASAIEYEENIFVSSNLPDDDIDDDTYDGIYRKTSYPYKLTARNLIDFYAGDGKQLEIFKHQLETYFYKDEDYPRLLSYVDTLLEAQLLRDNVSLSSLETTNILKPKKMTAKI